MWFSSRAGETLFFHPLGEGRIILFLQFFKQRFHRNAEDADGYEKADGKGQDEPAGKNGAVEEEKFDVHHGTEDQEGETGALPEGVQGGSDEGIRGARG